MSAIRTSECMPMIEGSTGEIGEVGSSSSLILPLVDGVNHLLGYKMMGPLHCQQSETTTSGTGQFYTYSHPNTQSLFAMFAVENVNAAGGTVVFTYGAGGAETVNVYGDGQYQCVFTRHAVDAENDTLVTYVATQCEIRWISIWGLWRQVMDPFGGDYACDRVDDTYRRAGLDEGHYVAFTAATEGFDRLAAEIKHAKEFTLRQAVSLSGMGSTTWTGSAAAWVSVFGSHVYRHRARKLRAADTTRPYTVYARTYFDGNPAGGDTYDWRIKTTSGDTATKAGLVRVAADWDQSTDDLDINCTADDDIWLEVQYAAAGTPTIYLCELSIFEKKI